MRNINSLKAKYNDRITIVSERSDIPRDTPLVYILFWGDQALVVGEGKANRARVITDDQKSITPNHKKAIKVRLYRLYGETSTPFSAFIIPCESKLEAQRVEKDLHGLIGGNDSAVDSKILDQLFDNLKEDSLVSILLKQALCSAFDGISDLKKWRREKIINDDAWTEVCNRLKLDYKMPNR
jgi:uncharacterized 2Fe-2S/4Fe-4S cluster protein (DUF4445 family)